MRQNHKDTPANVKATFLRVTRRVPGVLYEPVGRDDECLNTILVMHSDEDYLDVPTGASRSLLVSPALRCSLA